MTAPYLTNPADWDRLAALCRAAGRCGWDTETTGHNVKKSSPAFRARVDVWSLALPSKGVWRGMVLPREALTHSSLRAMLEDPSVVKDAHNARHDLHAAENHGVIVRGVYDTLEACRMAWPGLKSYTLKALRVEVLGKPERDTYKYLTRPMVQRTPYESQACMCCAPGCRKKSFPHVQIATTKYKEKRVKLDIADIGPGHERWRAKLDYAAADAEDSPELAEAAVARRLVLCTTLPELPW